MEFMLKMMEKSKLLLLMMDIKLDKESKEMKVQLLETWKKVSHFHVTLWKVDDKPHGQLYDQRNHHEFCTTRFQDLDEHIEVVQNQLFELQYGKDDWWISWFNVYFA